MIHTRTLLFAPIAAFLKFALIAAALTGGALPAGCQPAPQTPPVSPLSDSRISTGANNPNIAFRDQLNHLFSSGDVVHTAATRSARNVAPHVALAPAKTEVKYAEGFDITYHENYKLLEIYRPFQDASTDTLRYALVPRENMGKVNVGGVRQIPIPVESMVVTSTTHTALTNMLNANDRISGIVGAEFVYNPDIRQRLRNGKITAFPEGELNREVALAMEPELIMISGGQSSQFDTYRVLMNSGINVLVNAEWLETTPLGKAEWVKVMAALLDREQQANRQFEAVARRYRKLRDAAKDREAQPLVINNMPFKGAWFVSGGNSYTAEFLRDAGAEYPWFDTMETGGLSKSFEVVYDIGLRADIWIQPGAAGSKREVLMKDERFRDFKPFRTGRIYNNNRRENEAGGNDFWETGVVRPDLVLADLIHIFHPSVLPDHELTFYRKLD